jgi:phosphatidylinositol alpha 1,6-mannosyltransferase
VKIALVAETFLPATNGVVNSVLRVTDELVELGHTPVIIAPAGAPDSVTSRSGAQVEVRGVPSLDLPGYKGLRICRPLVDLTPLLAEVEPDVVHLASPLLLGRAGAIAADALGIPSVAVFQTDLSGFLRRYRLGFAAPLMWGALRHVHNLAALTLAPSTATAAQLGANGIGPVALWGRGVDGERFHPRRRSSQLRRLFTGGRDDLLVGFVGRLAPEKRCEMLAEVSRLDGVQLVVIGDGPRRAALQRLMPRAIFTGMLGGNELGKHVASLDLLVNTGADETFCQVVQEAHAAGVPVIAAASGGPLDLVRHRDNGWLWAGNDPRILAAMVAARRDDRAELRAVARRARASVHGRTWAELTYELVGHYHHVLGQDYPLPQRVA